MELTKLIGEDPSLDDLRRTGIFDHALQGVVFAGEGLNGELRNRCVQLQDLIVKTRKLGDLTIVRGDDVSDLGFGPGDLALECNDLLVSARNIAASSRNLSSGRLDIIVDGGQGEFCGRDRL